VACTKQKREKSIGTKTFKMGKPQEKTTRPSPIKSSTNNN